MRTVTEPEGEEAYDAAALAPASANDMIVIANSSRSRTSRNTVQAY
jgi:hypothetical protein